MRVVVTPKCALAKQRLMASFMPGNSHPLKEFQRTLGLMASAFPVLQLGLLRMRLIQRWLKPRVPFQKFHLASQTPTYQDGPGLHSRSGTLEKTSGMKQGVALGMVCRRKVVSTDASNTGWGALCEGKPTFGHWSKEESRLHIYNCLEMLAVCRAFHTFLPDLRGHHVLVRSDSMIMVSYINHQGGLSSKRIFILVERLLEWAQLNLRSLRATHVPGRLNQVADMLSRSNVPSEE